MNTVRIEKGKEFEWDILRKVDQVNVYTSSFTLASIVNDNTRTRQSIKSHLKLPYASMSHFQ